MVAEFFRSGCIVMMGVTVAGCGAFVVMFG